jgi:hypothetical protein
MTPGNIIKIVVTVLNVAACLVHLVAEIQRRRGGLP